MEIVPLIQVCNIAASATCNQFLFSPVTYIYPAPPLFPCVFPSASLVSQPSFACNPFACPPRSRATFVLLPFVVFYSCRDLLPASKMLMKSRLSFQLSIPFDTFLLIDELLRYTQQNQVLLTGIIHSQTNRETRKQLVVSSRRKIVCYLDRVFSRA